LARRTAHAAIDHLFAGLGEQEWLEAAALKEIRPWQLLVATM
jgi:hypothetical protein